MVKLGKPEVDSEDTSFNNSYVYDSFGQLIRENNKALDKTFIYGYNEIGNITSAKAYAYTTGSVEGLTALSTDSYTYDTTNKDELTYFGGAFVPCNAMGYHSGYNGYLVSWTNGKLSRLTKGFLPIGMHDYNYSYNALGQRVGISYTYTPPTSPSSSPVAMGTLLGYSKSYDYDQSGRLISESRTNEYYGELSDSEKIVFLYDEAGMVGFVYTTSGASNTYYFDKNIRGDVVGIYDANGTRIVKYSYDAWGNCTIDSSTTNTALAKTNPIRYRGYYYDEDIKFYYLNSRYYSPLWRRFISPDSTSYLDPETPNGLNLYAYCNNDPVNYSDPSGHSLVVAFVFLAIMTLAGAAVGDMAANTVEKNTGKEISGWDRFIYIATGASLGLMAGGILLSLSSVSYGLVMSVIKKKVITRVLYKGVLVSHYAATGFLGLSVGTFFFNVLTNSSLELVEWIEPYNTQQPIIQ